MEKQSFEALLERLTAINAELEGGDAGLERAVELFREGTSVVAELTGLLEAAELELIRLSPEPAQEG